MAIENLYQELEQGLQGRFPEAELRRIPAVESPTGREGVCIKFPESAAAPIIYLDETAAAFNAGMPIEEYLEQKTAGMSYVAGEHGREIVQEMSNPKNLIAVPAYRGMDMTELPHITIPGTDIGLYARCIVARDQDAEMSYRVTNQHLPLFHMTASEAMGRAMANSQQCEEYVIQPLSEKMLDLAGVTRRRGEGLHQSRSDEPWIITNQSGRYGATALAAVQVLQEAHERLGENFFVLPSSVHEVLIIGESFAKTEEEKDFLEAMIHEVNFSEVQPEDQLSERLLYFDGERLSFALSNTETMADSLDRGLSEDFIIAEPDTITHGRSR